MAISFRSTSFAAGVVNQYPSAPTYAVGRKFSKRLPELASVAKFVAALHRSVYSRTVSAFGYFVMHIFGRSTQKEMNRVDAQGDIAFMADIHSRRNWPKVFNPCHSMCLAALTLEIHRSIRPFNRAAFFSQVDNTWAHIANYNDMRGI